MPAWLDRLRDALAPDIVVEEELASGGMGHVALARDTLLDRPVAIKVLREEKASAVAAERFLREARHAARLRHPNIVQVHRTGEGDGLFYYSMDYVAGETLAQVVARGPLPPAEVVRLGRDLLAALGAAHAEGLIHRDVKPSNIFVTPDRILLGDFGIAYDLDSSRTELTRTGELVGTPAYISPEQLNDGEITGRTDIYAAGLVLFEAASGRRWMPQADPDRGNWSGVPGPLQGPIRRALQVDPNRRWPTVAAFGQALAEAGEAMAGPAPTRPRIALGLFPVAGVVVLAAVWLIVRSWPDDPRRDLVIVPFETLALADSSIGPRLSSLTGWSFVRLTDLKLAPQQIAIRTWLGSPLPRRQRLDHVIEATNSRHGAWARVLPREALLEVQLRVVGDDGKPLLERSVLGDSTDLPALGDSIAFTITRALYSERRLREPGPLASVPLAAETEFLLGEDAFARDAWLTAERHYLRALQLDSTFVLAAWRLGNARRWMPLRSEPPYPPALRRLFESQREMLPEVDRYLIEAQFSSSGAERFARYEEALSRPGGDPYAALLYGDELFHRGPLAGRSLQDAVRILERATAMDSTLAPAWEHLAWALIRLGERKRAAVALVNLERRAGRREESEIYLPMFLRLAYRFRFEPAAESGGGLEGLLRDPAALALAARGAMSFDLPGAQVEFGAALAARGQTPDLRASGHTARGVALFALGRPKEALAAFDSAAGLFTHPEEARLQAAEWRVIPAALGAPGVDDAERQRGRDALAAMLVDSLLGLRAAWALALDAYTRGDSAVGDAWAEWLRTAPAQVGGRLLPVLIGARLAARRRWDDAVAASAPALAWDSAGYAPDPFLRAALHLLRGQWLRRLGRGAEADRAWLWYENLDVRYWPSAEAQSAEVDWALGPFARASRAGLALERGASSSGCALGARAREIWSRVEPAVEESARELDTLLAGCPP